MADYKQRRYRQINKYKKQKGFYRAGKGKKQKTIFQSRFFRPVVLLLFISGTLIYFFIFSSVFKIKNIEINGNVKVKSEEIKNIVSEQINRKIFLFLSGNLFLFDSEKTEQLILEKFILIDSIKIKKKLFNTLSVNIEERVAVAVWCSQYIENGSRYIEDEEAEEIEKIEIEKCFSLDKTGIVYEKTEKKERIVIKSEKEINLGQRAIGQEKLEDILKINSGLENKLKIEVEEFFILEQKNKLIVILVEGWEIYFNPLENISEQLLNLELVLKEKIPLENGRQNLKYIDLRFGNKIFYKSN